VLCLLPLGLATFITMSRVAGYKHDFSDVNCGEQTTREKITKHPNYDVHSMGSCSADSAATARRPDA
jgi:hypothetical protein